MSGVEAPAQAAVLAQPLCFQGRGWGLGDDAFGYRASSLSTVEFFMITSQGSWNCVTYDISLR
jgi:hypothetical protein